MTTATTSRAATHPTTRRPGIVSAWLTAFREYRLYRRTLAQLERLGPRELDDIGLSPANLERAAWETAVGFKTNRSPR